MTEKEYFEQLQKYDIEVNKLFQENKKLKRNINKAIEYIEELFILEDDNVTYEFKNDEVKPLLKILKGE